MDLSKICEIATRTSSVRIAVSYCGDNKFAVGISDGVTSPIVANGTPAEIETIIQEQLSGYLEKVATEAAKRKAQADEEKRKAAEQAALSELKRKENVRKSAEKTTAAANKENQLELKLF